MAEETQSDKLAPPSLGAEEEIIEKKPTAPMAIALLMITFVVLVTGTYMGWSRLSDWYFRPMEYERKEDAQTFYRNFKSKIVMDPIKDKDPFSPDMGSELIEAPESAGE